MVFCWFLVQSVGARWLHLHGLCLGGNVWKPGLNWTPLLRHVISPAGLLDYMAVQVYTSKHFKRQEVKAAILLRSGFRNWHYITFVRVC